MKKLTSAGLFWSGLLLFMLVPLPATSFAEGLGLQSDAFIGAVSQADSIDNGEYDVRFTADKLTSSNWQIPSLDVNYQSVTLWDNFTRDYKPSDGSGYFYENKRPADVASSYNMKHRMSHKLT